MTRHNMYVDVDYTILFLAIMKLREYYYIMNTRYNVNIMIKKDQQNKNN